MPPSPPWGPRQHRHLEIAFDASPDHPEAGLEIAFMPASRPWQPFLPTLDPLRQPRWRGPLRCPRGGRPAAAPGGCRACRSRPPGRRVSSQGDPSARRGRRGRGGDVVGGCRSRRSDITRPASLAPAPARSAPSPRRRSLPASPPAGGDDRLRLIGAAPSPAAPCAPFRAAAHRRHRPLRRRSDPPPGWKTLAKRSSAPAPACADHRSTAREAACASMAPRSRPYRSISRPSAFSAARAEPCSRSAASRPFCDCGA